MAPIKSLIAADSPTGRLRQGLLDAGILAKQLQSREAIWELAFADYEKFQRLLEGQTQQPLRWALDDENILTRHDLFLRESGQAAIAFLQKVLAAQGFQPGTPEYEERLAVGLFYFASAPSPLRMHLLRSSIKTVLPTMEELKSLGLGDFYQYILDHGGWGVSFLDYEEGIKKEVSALEAFQKGIGACTEVSKLLFSLFRMAGLKPRFVFLLAQDAADALRPMLMEKPKVEMWGHMVVGLQWGARWRYFDSLNGVLSNAPFHQKARALTLREYYYADLLNQLNAKAKEEAMVEGDSLFQLMEELGEVAFIGDRKYLLKASLALQKGDKESAIAFYKKALRQNPESREAIALLAGLYFEAEKCPQADPYLKKLILFPEVQDQALAGLYFCNQRAWRKETHWLALFDRAIAVNPENMGLRFLYSTLLTLHRQYPKAEEQFGRMLFYQPGETDLWGNITLLRLLEGRWEEAKEIMEGLDPEMAFKLPTFHLLAAKYMWENQDPAGSRAALGKFSHWVQKNVGAGSLPAYAFEISRRIFQLFPQEMWQDPDIRDQGVAVFTHLANRADVSSDWELLREIALAGLQLRPNDCFMLKELLLAERELKHRRAALQTCHQMQKSCGTSQGCP